MATCYHDLLCRSGPLPDPRLYGLPCIPSVQGESRADITAGISNASQWIAFGVCFWAIASLLQDAAFNLGGLAVCRLFIGVGEGLFGTGILYYLSLWYKRGEMGVRVFWFLGPTAIAGCVLHEDIDNGATADASAALSVD